MKHYNIIVSGKVQGVFYRKSAVKAGQQLGIKGFVRNEMNGSVYIEAEGTSEELTKFVEWCKKGPARAIVSDVKIEEGEIKYYSVLETLT